MIVIISRLKEGNTKLPRRIIVEYANQTIQFIEEKDAEKWVQIMDELILFAHNYPYAFQRQLLELESINWQTESCIDALRPFSSSESDET